MNEPLLVARVCRACGAVGLEPVLDFGDMPIAHRLLQRVDQPFSTYPFSVVYCESCGLLQLANPIPPDKLYLDFNFCFSEWKPQPHIADELAMLQRHIPPGNIGEIGCNDGLFLSELRDAGYETLFGFEPNPHAARRARAKGFEVREAMLDPDICRRAVEERGPFQLVIARQVLEHLLDPSMFFRCADILLEDNGCMFIDVPDVGTALRAGDCSVLWEEHVSYFTPDTLRGLLHRHAYELVEEMQFNFSGGGTALLARRTENTVAYSATPAHTEVVRHFGMKAQTYGKQLRDTLEYCRENLGWEVVLYGAGCRACTLVNGLGLGAFINYAIDDQEDRQGLFLSGSRLPVLARERLQATSSDILILLAVNQENEEAVKARIADYNMTAVTFLSVCSPNDIQTDLACLRCNLDLD